MPLSSDSLICPPSYGLGIQYFVSTPLVVFLSPLLRPLIAGLYLLLLIRAGGIEPKCPVLFYCLTSVWPAVLLALLVPVRYYFPALCVRLVLFYI
jgi:hypothetical protein